ncbi:cytoskeleton protein RodZ [Acidovorax sp. 69]|uniref:RodZ domain-containing protein n=1 Tax=Acidovorax sp. 69 TaxID=2035202 RepID=UPI000C236FD3|nr:RodZ domain-containing protein [Acidovorax sp. 69]PJI96995.1 cytoskeleton protein RodZ [Acidovorax sp. 69]
MSEVVESGGGLTAGGLLREARLASGLHIAALAVALKVPVNKLEALEADNFTVLPDTVFVRALASSVCRTLKIDPVPILSLLPQSPSPRLSADSAGINAPVKGRVGKSSVSSASFSGGGAVSRPVAWVVLALLVGALILYFFPRHEEGSTLSEVVAVMPPDAVSVEVPASTAAAERPAETHMGGLPATTATVAATATVVTPAVAPASVALVPASVPAVLTGADVAADALTGTLVLRARSASWVQVKDATGALALQRSLAAGESVSVSAPTPLAVVVGRADATEVIVRGKPFDLTAVSRENVARFEVK